MSYIEVGLGDVIRTIKELRVLRDSLRNRLTVKIPRNYVVGNTDVLARPMFTDGFIVSFKVGTREYRVWWSGIEDSLSGRSGDWSEYRVVAGKEPYIEFLNPDGSVAARVKINEELINRLDGLLNAAFLLSVVDWFIEDNIRSIANIANVFISEDYSELRYISDFVETMHSKLSELNIIKELEDGVRRIELECHTNNHRNREVVEVIPVGKYYLCPDCLRRAEEYVDEVLSKWRDIKIRVPAESWQGLQKGIEQTKEVIQTITKTM
ncbi:hypothetical protein [Vulcanisaeta souniana]|uniref:Uncharacterized protein n=1 Tax=Vulcanisaeta souniana JCM 11219 TaxID=1293586 RepID=A0A830E5M0_9CREN|nr:hypothetical protein [Vulcanisaeta souniana]BDR92659.1 hypothetical protein Vsou_17520 [Vulcanisaeta souniana JCM 11219]GGI84540.1 hypothetical protein GCM10007112_21960 [Vulcanisaeta souniana JCM 11219]